MKANRKVLECKIVLEGMKLPIEDISETLNNKGFETIERPLIFDNYRNCTKAEIEVFRVVKNIDECGL